MKTIRKIEYRYCRSGFSLPALFIFLFVSLLAAAQVNPTQKRKEEMQQQMKKLQQEIKEIEAIIESTSRKKKQSIGELESLMAKIKSREQLIHQLRLQLRAIEGDIQETERDLLKQTQKVEQMKQQYAAMVRQAYRQLSLQNEWIFVVSSSSFREALTRYRLLKHMANFRRIQAKQLQTEIEQLAAKKKELENEKNEQLLIYTEENQQQRLLMLEKKQQSEMVAKLSDQEKRLRKQFEQKQQAIKILNKKIEAIIAEEIRLARLRANEGRPALKNPATAEKKEYEPMPMTPEEIALSHDFAGNKGKLPWPVTRGHIVSGFGRREHPTLKGVFIENNGIDIKTTAGSEARAMFDGVVVSVFSLPTTNTCVILKHGEYFTVYSNIEEATVKPGQKVTIKQSLGKLVSDSEENLTKVHVEIWRGKEKIDPELWLATR
jgi:septal ring factor EnvC (AmiA/AmiB activator)